MDKYKKAFHIKTLVESAISLFKSYDQEVFDYNEIHPLQKTLQKYLNKFGGVEASLNYPIYKNSARTSKWLFPLHVLLENKGNEVEFLIDFTRKPPYEENKKYKIKSAQLPVVMVNRNNGKCAVV